MREKNSNEQNQSVGNTDNSTHTNTTNNVGVEQHEETPTAPENGTDATSESSNPGPANNDDVEQSKETQSPLKEGSDSTSTVQGAPTPNPAEQYPNLSTEINRHVSESLEKQTELLVEKLNSRNQTLDDIKKFTEDFKENNLLEAEFVIRNLTQFYDTFVLVESQLNAINEIFESLGNQIDAIPDAPQSDATPDTQVDAIMGKLESVKDWVDRRLSEGADKKLKNKMNRIKKPVEDILKKCEGLHGMLQDIPPSSQEDTETEDGSVVPPEEPRDSLSLLSEAKTELEGKLSQFRHNLENALYEFKDVLERIDDVVPYKTVPDETSDLSFDRKKHTSVDSKRTDDKAQDLQVAESHKAGFYRGEEQTVFRHEEVTVYRYEEPANDPTEPDVESPAAENVTVDADAEGTTQESSTTAGGVSADEKGEKENE